MVHVEGKSRILSAESEAGEEGEGRSHDTRKCSHMRMPSSESDTILGEKY